jgi:hypothetical protein
MGMVLSSIWDTLRDPRQEASSDPLVRARTALRTEPSRLKALEDDVAREIDALLATAVQEVRA